MLDPGQGTFVLRRWLHVSGAEPITLTDRSIEPQLGAEGRFAAFTDRAKYQDARAHAQREVQQAQAEAAGRGHPDRGPLRPHRGDLPGACTPPVAYRAISVRRSQPG